MARNKKPKRRYNPNRVMASRNLPNWADMFQIFNPIYTAFEQLASGNYFEADGVPVFKDCFGEWSEISAAMLGWNDCFARICKHTNRPFDREPLNKLAIALTEGGGELTAEILKAGLDTVRYTQKVFQSTPAEVIREHANTEQIAIEFQKIGLAA